MGQRIWAKFGFAAAAFFVGLSGSAAAANRIEWQLENPFRLFKNPADTELHRRIYDQLGGIEADTPVLAAERRLAERSGGRGWAKGVFNNTCYNQDGDRYNACSDYVLPKSHRIVATLTPDRKFWNLFGRAPSNESCHWLLEDHAGAALARKTAPCNAAVKFDVPYPGGARLSVSRWSGPAETAVDVTVQDLLIVGMGDSFGAGEGNPDSPVQFNDGRSYDYGSIEIAATRQTAKLDGYPAREGGWTKLSGSAFRKERARWWDRECHRSLYSHQLRAALQLAIENPQRAITFLSFACSGSEIVQGILLRAPVRECTPGEPFTVSSQLSAMAQELCQTVNPRAQMPAAVIQRMPELRSVAEREMRVARCSASPQGSGHRALLKRPIDMVFLSVGGNDVGFTQLIADSILSENSIYRVLGQRMNAVFGVGRARKQIDLLKKRFEGLKFALELFFNTREGTKVILTGYPNMGYEADGMSACNGSKGLEVFPAFQIDAAKLGKAEDFSTELNQSLAAFAGRDWTFVDGFRGDFRGHGLCASRGEGTAESVAFPRLKNGAWTPYKPSAFQPYSSRQRWFRTPNDAFMTAHMHADTISNFGANCSGIYSTAFKTVARRHWLPFQLFVGSTYGGAFHPTAEGQARIADELVKAARTSLHATQ